jgi:hypothetical protein
MDLGVDSVQGVMLVMDVTASQVSPARTGPVILVSISKLRGSDYISINIVL